MQTHLISREHVQAYLRGFLEYLDLEGTPGDLPKIQARLKNIVWIPIGESGISIWLELLKIFADMVNAKPGDLRTTSLLAIVHRNTRAVSWYNTQHQPLTDTEVANSVQGKEVIVLDSVVFSGKSMEAVYDGMQNFGPASVFTYGLCIKNGVGYVPSYFSRMIHDRDRVFLLIPKIYCQSIFVRHRRKGLRHENGAMRQILPAHIGPLRALHAPYMIGDVLVVCNRKPNAPTRMSYLFETPSDILACISFLIENDVCEIVTFRNFVHLVSFPNRYAAFSLLKFAEIHARHGRCREIILECPNQYVDAFVSYKYAVVAQGSNSTKLRKYLY